MSFVINPHLILLISVQRLMGWVVEKILETKQTLRKQTRKKREQQKVSLCTLTSMI
jgi:Na+-transporting methylmalonyl-CoA/oxaloacetate decarboxylase gamma subunit